MQNVVKIAKIIHSNKYQKDGITNDIKPCRRKAD